MPVATSSNLLVRSLRIGVLAFVLTLATAACSSSATSGGSSGTARSTAPTSASGSAVAGRDVDLSKYNGTDAQALKAGQLTAPADQHLSGCKVGFLQAYGGQKNLTAMQDATEQALKKYGCKMIGLDSQLNPQTQVSQFQQLLAQNVKAVILMPVAVNALAPSLKQAKARGIPVIGFNLPFDLSKPDNPLIKTNVSTAQDFACYAVMKQLADARPGSTFAIMGTSIPSDQLQYFIKRYEYWGKQLGLKYLGKVDALGDDPNAFTPAIQSIFTKWPHVENLVSYSDNFALTAATIAAQQGKSNVHIVDSNGGVATLVPAIKAGRVFGNYFVPWEEAGRQMAYASYLAVAGKDVPSTVVLRSKEVTRTNTDDFEFVK